MRDRDRRPLLSRRGIRRVALGLAALGGLAAATVWGRPWPQGGPPALALVRPLEGERVGPAGLAVVVRFGDGQAVPETFRALLNGADVSRLFTRDGGEATAHLHGLLDGENTLRVEVFGPAAAADCWPDLLPEGTFREFHREVRVVLRRPLDVDRG